MRSWSFSTFLLVAIISASAVPAHEIDVALAREEKRQVSLSTGGTTTSSTATPTTSEAPSDTTTVFTSEVTSEGSTVIESTTQVITPSVSQSTTVVESTITRATTNANGQTTSVAETILSTATSPVTYQTSYSNVVTSFTSQVVETYTQVDGGSTVTGTRTRSTVLPTTSRAAVTAVAEGQDNGGGNGGLSASSKKIIGGVVGGIGGALLIGALGFTAWRVWGKKKTLHDDDLYDPNARHTEKMSNSTENPQTPFQSTLNQYHNPGPVNPASNF